MRIPSGWPWLGVVTALPSLVAGGNVNFDIRGIANLRSLDNGTLLNIINVDAVALGSSAVVVNWTAGDGGLPKTIRLRAFDVKKKTADQVGIAGVSSEVVVTTTVTASDGGGRPLFTTFTRTGPPSIPTSFPPGRKRSGITKAAAEVFPTVQLEVTPPSPPGPGNVKISNLNQLLDPRVKGFPFFFEAIFSDGTSLSPAFTVLQPDDLLPDYAAEFFTNERPFPSDKIKTPDSNGNVTPGGSGNSDGSSGGLATGAIAGIAVGCAVIILAAIGAAAWFFIRRRQQARDDDTLDAYGNGRTRTDELMAEKEANAGVDVSPHSPYSDDGGQRDSSSLHNVGVGTGVAAAAAVGHHKKDLSQSTQNAHGRSFTPYSDHHDAVARSPSTHAASVVAASNVSHGAPESPNPGRATPHGVPTPYAHLVEEGMTEDEIRRLEDEERALDAAIEQSAVKRT